MTKQGNNAWLIPEMEEHFATKKETLAREGSLARQLRRQRGTHAWSDKGKRRKRRKSG